MFPSCHESPCLQPGALALPPRRLECGAAGGFYRPSRRDPKRRGRRRHVGKSRESAYRLRNKPGAQSFAAAWDSILAQRSAARMSTVELLWHRAFYGTLKPIMRGGKHVAIRHSPDNDAVLRLYRREMGRRRSLRDRDGRSR
jgi:hypothetical protein